MEQMEDFLLNNGDNELIQEEEDIGTLPINLPDPSMFSDIQENENSVHNKSVYGI